MQSSSVLALLSVLSAFATALCACSFYRHKLVANYPAVFAYLVCQTLFLVSASIVGLRSPLYAWIFGLGYPTTWILYGMIVRSFYAEVFSAYPGITRSARWSVYFSGIAAIAAAFVSGAVTRDALANRHSLLIALEFIGRGVVFGIALLTICLILIISRYPIRVSRNVLTNCGCFCMLLLLDAAATLADHLVGLAYTGLINALYTLLNAGLYLTWAAMLARKEAVPMIKLRRSRPLEEPRLLRQLEEISTLLLRASRKQSQF